MKIPLLKTLADVTLLITASVAHADPKRYAWITGLKPEAAAKYEDLHAHTWPGVNKMNKECHIQNFSIDEIQIDGKLYLFAHLEYTGDDFDADVKNPGASSGAFQKYDFRTRTSKVEASFEVSDPKGMKKMGADPEVQRWWKETDPCQLPLPTAAAKGKIWTDMKEVYFMP